MNASCCRASALCEEFSDYNSDSVLVNIDEEHFQVIYRELFKIGYVLVFKTYLYTTNSLTCTFIKE